MASGTSGFESWLQAREATLRGLGLPAALDRIAAEASAAFGARLRFVRTLHRRWSFLAGDRSDELLPGDTCQIPLGGQLGLVCTGWGRLGVEDQSHLVDWLNALIAARYGTGEQPPSR